MTTLHPLLAQFASQPCLVEPSMRDSFVACLNELAAHADYGRLTDQESASDCGGDDFWFSSDDWRSRYRPYVVKDGLLHIPIRGVLLHNFPFAFGNYATGYDYIWKAFERGCGDFSTGVIKGIALVEDSPGGMVAGCFDNAERMLALKAKTGTPVRAFAHEAAYSAAYVPACVADHIAVSQTGGVGSIGIRTTHIDWTKFNDNMGLKYTFIFAGKGKTDGDPDQVLSAEAEQRIQARIDELYDVFVGFVSRNRGIEDKVIREDLGAHTFTATQAVSNGLADSIGSLDDAVAAFAADLSETSGEDEMSTQDKTAVDLAAHETAVTEATAAGRTEGSTAERQRISAIIGSDEAKDRPAAAMAAAMDTDMTVAQATAFLGKLPKETPAAVAPAAEEPAAASPFAGAMDANNPGVGAGVDKTDEQAAADGSDIIALARTVGLSGVRPALNS